VVGLKDFEKNAVRFLFIQFYIKRLITFSLLVQSAMVVCSLPS
jgi:hypothetical protein